ncbi:MAG TPA: TetR/AcrR family transcriptional regulator [Dehalococcoidia bacterium]|nr:TetR/AcrR family transcriptional regulator [Dehalococcoidia bacterium]
MSQKHMSTLVRREQIADAAGKIIVRHGCENLTIKRLASEIGVTDGAIYRHFKSKKDILLLLIEHVEGNLVGDLDKGRVSESSPLEAFDDIVARHVASIRKRKGVSFQVIAEIISLGDRELNSRMYAGLQKYRARVRELLAVGVASGEIKAELDLDAAATLFFGMMQGMANLWALDSHGPDLDKNYIRVWNIFRGAIARNN